MARPKDDETVDLHVANAAKELTAGLIERLQCPQGKSQAFLRDLKSPGLRVRVTAAGAKSFVFEAKLARQTIRRTIGDVRSWTIDAARMEANRLRVLVDGGTDPRELERQQEAARVVRTATEAAEAVTGGEVWSTYVEARRPRWGDLHYRDHIAKAKAGGVPALRGTRGRGKTIDGPLYPLMQLKLRELTPPTISAWAAKETETRATAARLSWRCPRRLKSDPPCRSNIDPGRVAAF